MGSWGMPVMFYFFIWVAGPPGLSSTLHIIQAICHIFHYSQHLGLSLDIRCIKKSLTTLQCKLVNNDNWHYDLSPHHIKTPRLSPPSAVFHSTALENNLLIPTNFHLSQFSSTHLNPLLYLEIQDESPNAISHPLKSFIITSSKSQISSSCRSLSPPFPRQCRCCSSSRLTPWGADCVTTRYLLLFAKKNLTASAGQTKLQRNQLSRSPAHTGRFSNSGLSPLTLL